MFSRVYTLVPGSIWGEVGAFRYFSILRRIALRESQVFGISLRLL